MGSDDPFASVADSREGHVTSKMLGFSVKVLDNEPREVTVLGQEKRVSASEVYVCSSEPATYSNQSVFVYERVELVHGTLLLYMSLSVVRALV